MKGRDNIRKLALRILGWFCPNHLLEEIEGDLIQKFEREIKALGAGEGKTKTSMEHRQILQTRDHSEIPVNL